MTSFARRCPRHVRAGSRAKLQVVRKLLSRLCDVNAPGTMDLASVSVANGVLYAGSYSEQMYALNAISGDVLWGFASGGSVLDGPSIVDGTVYWGSGYRNIRPGTGNNKLYAFTVAGSDDHDDQSDDHHEH